MFKRAFYSSLALLLAAPALAKVEAVDGYVRLLPPGSPNTAAFMVLKNDADKPVTLPFPLTLTLDDGQTLSLSLPVKPVEPMKGMQH